MGENLGIVILDNTAAMRGRIKGVIGEESMQIYEAADSMALFNIINQKGEEIKLVIMDVELSGEDGFGIIKRIKQKCPSIPIIIMTSNNKKDIFLKGITEGASDFILKPFEDEFLRNRIKKYLEASTDLQEASGIVLKSLDQYINSELRKAKKGGYPLSLLMSTFFKPVNEVTAEIEKEYLALSGVIYTSLNEIFWDTDVFVQYGSQSFIGVFPFCDKSNTAIIEEKLNNRFDTLKNRNSRLSQFILANTFVTYPDVGDSFEALMDRLTVRLKARIQEEKLATGGSTNEA